MFSSNTTQVSTGGYQISRSLRFNSADSTSLNRTPASAGNRRTWTWSGWVKLSKTSFNNLLEVVGPTTPGTRTSFMVQDQNNIAFFTDNTTSSLLTTTQVFRDFSAWYHIVLAVDTTQATAANRVKIYVNGSQITAFSTANYPAQNLDTQVNNTQLHTIGQVYDPFYANMYMTEVNFIDGQALTPSSFGETNAQTGVWQPKAYSGSYGTNGFYLNFSDNSNTTDTTLGKDYSGNGNNWTPNNFSVSAGAGNDSLVDSPTSYGTDTGVGGEVRGNYCTLNPVSARGTTLTNGNLDASVGGDANAGYGTIGISSGKWYWEVLYVSGTNAMIGIANTSTGTGAWVNAYGWAYYEDGAKYTNNTRSAGYGASYAANAIISVALDMDAGTLTFYKNGASQGVAYSSLTGTMTPYLGNGGGATAYSINLGQRPFAYTAPSGFKALCTQNLPTPTIGATTATQAGKYFNAVTYTGNAANPRTITGVGFQPDWVWGKTRSTVANNIVFDAVRGVSSTNAPGLLTDTTGAEANYYTVNGGVTAFTSDGFTASGGSTNSNFNANGVTYVAWNWKANGSGSTNTAGSITSTVSANTTSGFSVVTYTGNGATGATIGHGLGVAPKMYIVKCRSTTGFWPVWHTSLYAQNQATYIALNYDSASNVYDGVFTTNGPTSTTFAIGSDINANGNTYVAYCFAEVAGYSKFGSYTGNGSTDGPFVFTGMRPAYVLIKKTSAADEWFVWDSKRSTINQITGGYLAPNRTSAEGTTEAVMDLVSNGFKIRGTNTSWNLNGATYIFACFAESPFKYSLAR